MTKPNEQNSPPMFTADNWDCGVDTTYPPPAALRSEKDGLFYVGYFAGANGGQYILKIHKDKRRGRLWISNQDWYCAKFSTASELFGLLREEQDVVFWIRACWMAVTGEDLGPLSIIERAAAEKRRWQISLPTGDDDALEKLILPLLIWRVRFENVIVSFPDPIVTSLLAIGLPACPEEVVREARTRMPDDGKLFFQLRPIALEAVRNLEGMGLAPIQVA